MNLKELAGENIVAVCDIDWRTRAQLPGRLTLASEVAAAHPSAKKFGGRRVMLEQMPKNLDAVVVCPADHVHAGFEDARKLIEGVYGAAIVATDVATTASLRHLSQIVDAAAATQKASCVSWSTDDGSSNNARCSALKRSSFGRGTTAVGTVLSLRRLLLP